MKKPWGDTMIYGFFAVLDILAAVYLVDARWAVIGCAVGGGVMLGLTYARWVNWWLRREATAP